MANNQGKEKKNINKEDKKWEIIRNGVQKRTAHRVYSDYVEKTPLFWFKVSSF